MKNFVVLLTSLLLAGAANAGVAEFTTGETQAEGWQDFQVAHTCSAGAVHIPNHDTSHEHLGEYGTGGRDGKGHIRPEGAHCVLVWKIKKCAAEDRPVKLWSQTTNRAASVDEVCDARCGGNTAPRGGVCVTTNVRAPEAAAITDTPRVVRRDVWQRDDCPPGHVWQEAPQTCMSHAQLDHYCRTREKEDGGKRRDKHGGKLRNEVYLVAENKCGCAPGHSWQVEHEQCQSFAHLDKWCKEKDKGRGNMVYLPETNTCGCPAGSSVQQHKYKSGLRWHTYDVCIPFAELDKFCRDTQKKVYDPTIGSNGACGKCIAEHSLQKRSERRGILRRWHDYTECVSFRELGAHCRNNQQVYNPASDKCERSCPSGQKTDSKNICRGCPAGHSWQESLNTCVPFAELGVYCNNAHGKVYSPKTDACESGCLDGRTPDSDSVCR